MTKAEQWVKDIWHQELAAGWRLSVTWPSSCCVQAWERNVGAWEEWGAPSPLLNAAHNWGKGGGRAHLSRNLLFTLHSFNKYLASSILLTSLYQSWIIPSHSLSFFFFFFWPHCEAWGILFPNQGLNPQTPVLAKWSLNHGYVLSRFSHVRLFATPWAVALQALLSMGFSRQEYWSGLPCPPSRGSSWPQDWTHISSVSCTGRRVLYHWRHLRSPLNHRTAREGKCPEPFCLTMVSHPILSCFTKTPNKGITNKSSHSRFSLSGIFYIFLSML